MICKYLIIACFIIFYSILVLPTVFDLSSGSTVFAEETIQNETFHTKLNSNKLFPSYLHIYAPTEWWREKKKANAEKYPIFQLSQNYPRNEPVQQSFPWQNPKYANIFNVNKSAQERWEKWGRKYLTEVLKYAYKENISLDENIENDWNPAIKDKPQWFHAPWLHTDKKNDPKPRGREFIHGLTKERCNCKEELDGKSECTETPKPKPGFDNKACSNPKEPIQNWGVAVFNNLGGYNINRIWQEMTIYQNGKGEYPNPKNFKKMDFPNGTVIVKLLFTAATNEEAAFLEKSNLVWRTDINRAGLNSHPDEIESYPTLRLLQIDLAVRDSRADEFSGWVFGTFTYNPLRNLTKEIGKFDGWEKVEPLGLMFGNDPEVKIAGFKNLKESLINEAIEKTQHLGCGQRLNGTVDNPRSSCIACHSRDAEVQISKTDNHSINFTEIKYKISSPTCDIFENTLDQTDLSYWFKNIKPRETFSRKTKRVKYFPLHNVLQMQIGITRYCDAFPKHCRDENFMKKLKETDIETPQMKESSRGED